MRILIADDEPEMTMVLEALLRREHYSVDIVGNGQDALDYGLTENYDCLIWDIMMPKLNGIEVLRALRARNISVPVLLLTAKSQVEDRVLGLDSGADDYLPKPFDNREFIARVRALTRRGGEYMPSVLSAGNMTLNRATFELTCGASCVRLGNKEFQMLELLMRQKGRLVSTEQFKEQAAVFSVTETAEACADAFEPMAGADGKTLIAGIAAGITLRGVQDDLFRLFSILLDNAVKYCDPGGEIRFALFLRGRNICISVSNPCAGLDAALLPRYFDRFYRADSSRARATGGYGIGLSTARAIVTRHRGHISNRYANGVITFTAVIPQAG